MKNLTWVVFCCLTLASIASGQAAVEGALAHSLSGAGTAAAGKALGQVGNQLAGRLGQQTSNVARPAVVRPGAQKVVKVPHAATTATPTTSGGSLIASIQGGEPQQEKPCAQGSADKTKKATDCRETKAPADQVAHPSEITLPAPK